VGRIVLLLLLMGNMAGCASTMVGSEGQSFRYPYSLPSPAWYGQYDCAEEELRAEMENFSLRVSPGSTLCAVFGRYGEPSTHSSMETAAGPLFGRGEFFHGMWQLRGRTVASVRAVRHTGGPLDTEGVFVVQSASYYNR